MASEILVYLVGTQNFMMSVDTEDPVNGIWLHDETERATERHAHQLGPDNHVAVYGYDSRTGSYKTAAHPPSTGEVPHLCGSMHSTWYKTRQTSLYCAFIIQLTFRRFHNLGNASEVPQPLWTPYPGIIKVSELSKFSKV